MNGFCEVSQEAKFVKNRLKKLWTVTVFSHSSDSFTFYRILHLSQITSKEKDEIFTRNKQPHTGGASLVRHVFSVIAPHVRWLFVQCAMHMPYWAGSSFEAVVIRGCRKDFFRRWGNGGFFQNVAKGFFPVCEIISSKLENQRKIIFWTNFCTKLSNFKILGRQTPASFWRPCCYRELISWEFHGIISASVTAVCGCWWRMLHLV